jgi:hypothetical protein
VTKEKAIANAQSAANREGKPMVVLNLNRYSPLYVVRYYETRMMSDAIVAILQPQTE